MADQGGQHTGHHRIVERVEEHTQCNERQQTAVKLTERQPVESCAGVDRLLRHRVPQSAVRSEAVMPAFPEFPLRAEDRRGAGCSEIRIFS